MFCHAKLDRDLESNRGKAEIIDFAQPNWIVKHHRHNLLQKIVQPKHSFGLLGSLWSKISGQSTKDYNNHTNHEQKPRDDQNQGTTGDNKHQLGRDGDTTTERPNSGPLEESQQSYRINFCELQRLHLRQLQRKLVQHTVNLVYKTREPSGWADDLRKYGGYNFKQYTPLSSFFPL
jgi:hypothetical protein